MLFGELNSIHFPKLFFGSDWLNKLLVLLTGSKYLSFRNTCGVRPARLQVTTDYLRGVWSQEVNLGWRMLVSLNTFYFAIQTYRLFVLYLLPRARRVNRTLINNSNNLPVETRLPWISSSSASVCWISHYLVTSCTQVWEIIWHFWSFAPSGICHNESHLDFLQAG